MVSHRAFFVRWERFGTNVLELFGAGSVDVRPPSKLRCTEQKPLVWSDVQSRGAAAVDRAVGSLLQHTGGPNDCLLLGSNLAPENMNWAESTPFGKAFGGLIQPGYLRGCAHNFLFRPSAAWITVRDRHRPSINQCGGRAPAPHVGIHIRLGDDFRASVKKPEQVKQAITCAKAVGTEIFGPMLQDGRLAWWIAFVADSGQARTLAAQEARIQGLTNLFSTPAKPVHSDKPPLAFQKNRSRAREVLFEIWEDEAILADSAALVSGGRWRSGFAEAAAQIGQIPSKRFYGLTCQPRPLGCSPHCAEAKRMPKSPPPQ